MKAKSTILTLTLTIVFSILLLTSASAILNLKVVSVPSSISHDQATIPIIFSLSNTETTAQTDLKWLGASNIGEWKNLDSLPNTINAGSQIQFTAVLSIPKHKSSPISSNINVVSKEGQADSLNLPSIQITRSPSFSITKTQDLTEAKNGIIDLTNTGNIDLTQIQLSSSGSLEVILSSTTLSIPAGNSATINITGKDFSNLKFGKNSATITAKDSIETSASATVTLSIDKGFCKFGEAGGNLTINDVSIESDGEDEDEWKPLDVITIEVEVENEGDEEIEDVFVELGLFDSNGKNFADDLDFMNEDEERIEVGDLGDGDEETLTFKFKVPADFDEKGTFKLAIKAHSKQKGEKNECTHTSSDLDNTIFQEIKIEREDEEGKFIAIDEVKLEPTEAVCGDTVKLTTVIFNLGSKEQDQVKIKLVNSKLNLDLSREIREDLDEGDKKTVEFQFIVPATATDGTYLLELNAEYDYRRGTYRESSDESTTTSFKVFGCKAEGKKEDKIATISASLESDAKAGQEILVKTVVTNLGSQQKDFVVTASGYENWATLSSISERLINLKAGEAKDVMVKLNASPDASGEKSFLLEVRSGDKLETREIAVNVEGKQQGPSFNLGGNNLIWIIGIINIILIILIIVVAIRVSRR